MIQAAWTLLAPLLAPQTLIWANPNAPRPPVPYCSLHVTRTNEARFPVVYRPGTDGVQGYSVMREHMVELTCYGAGGVDLARATAFRLKVETSLARAEALGVAVSTVRPTQSMPMLLDKARYEERGILEFDLYQVVEITDQVGVIEEADIPCWPTDSAEP